LCDLRRGIASQGMGPECRASDHLRDSWVRS
jgi:hypothetical protein